MQKKNYSQLYSIIPNTNSFIFINFYYFSTDFCHSTKVNYQQDIIIHKLQSQFIIILKHGRTIIQHLNQLIRIGYKILIYADQSFNQIIETINILQTYAKQQLSQKIKIQGVIYKQTNKVIPIYLIKQMQGIIKSWYDCQQIHLQSLLEIFYGNFQKQVTQQNLYIIDPQMKKQQIEIQLNLINSNNICQTFDALLNKINEIQQIYKNMGNKTILNNEQINIQIKIKRNKQQYQNLYQTLKQWQIVQFLKFQPILNIIITNFAQLQLISQKKHSRKFAIYNLIINKLIETEHVGVINMQQFYSCLAFEMFKYQSQLYQQQAQTLFLGISFYQNKFYQILFNSSLINTKIQTKFIKYSFIHQNILQYFIVTYIISSINYPFQNIHQFIFDIIKSPSICKLIKQMFYQNFNLYKTMMQIVINTRIDTTFQQNAALAITLLNIAGQNFSNMDLTRISIPNANLNDGYFNNTDFTESNLTNVTFCNSYCYSTIFNKCKMYGVQFGQVSTIPFHETVNCMDIDVTGKYLIAGGLTKKTLYDIKSQKILNQYVTNLSYQKIKFMIDSKIIVSSHGNLLKVWSTSQNAFLYDLKGHIQQISTIDCLSDGTQIVTGSFDQTIRIWNIFTGKFEVIEAHDDRVVSVCYSFNKKIIISSSLDNTIKMWDRYKKSLLITINQKQYSISSICCSYDLKYLISGNNNGMIRIWDFQSRKIIKTLSGHSGKVTSVGFVPNTNNIWSSNYDRSILIWDIKTGQKIKILQGHRNWVTQACATPKHKIISISCDNTIKIWNIDRFQHIRQTIKCSHQGPIYCVRFSDNSKLILSTSADRTIKIWDSETGFIIKTLKGHLDTVAAAYFHNGEEEIIVSGSWDATIRIWNLQQLNSLRILKGHKDIITAVCHSANYQKIISGSADQTIKIWDYETSANTMNFIGHRNSIKTLCCSPVQNKIASCSWEIKIWNMDTGMIYLNLNAVAQSVQFSSDGKLVVSGGRDNLIRIWDSKTGINLIKFQDSNWVLSICFSPDNKNIISGGRDPLIKIWNLQNEKNDKLVGHRDSVISINCSKDGSKIVSGSNNNTIKIWNIKNNYKSILFYSIPEEICLRQVISKQIYGQYNIRKIIDEYN